MEIVFVISACCNISSMSHNVIMATIIIVPVGILSNYNICIKSSRESLPCQHCIFEKENLSAWKVYRLSNRNQVQQGVNVSWGDVVPPVLPLFASWHCASQTDIAVQGHILQIEYIMEHYKQY